ncbi:MAG: GNAT family N-acetyltransferase [Chloroflexi bacterium]|nr:GNAT family N-acetyltransferase [Chloroflexota bacterium]
MKVSLYKSEAVFSDLREEWNALLADSLADQIFLTFEWQTCWWSAYQPGDLWVVVVRDEETNRVDGVAPWFIRTEDDGEVIVRAIGCVDVTDYLEVIARQGQEPAVFAALADFLMDQMGPSGQQVDLVQLCNIPEESQTFALMPSTFERKGLAVEIELQEVCPVVRLPETWPDYVASLDKKDRHELRRKLRRAGNGNGGVDWYVVGPDHNLEEEMARFLELMAASSSEKAEFLQEPENVAFFRSVMPELAAQEWLQLAFLTVRNEPVAAYLNFEYANRVLVYNSGHNAADFGHLSPGIVLLGRLIEHAINNERAEFDFLRGDEPYKYQMGGQNRSVYQLKIRLAA